MMMAATAPRRRPEVRAFNMGFILACPQSFVNPCGQICGKQGNPLHTRQISVDNYLLF
jgi:hypothetical protein